jgi:acyl dehydratase
MMALNYENLMALKRMGDRFSYTDRETMLYAISIGMSRDPYAESELAYTFETVKLKTVASMATVLQRVPLLKDCGYDYNKVVHGEQRLTLHRPLEPEGEIVVDSRVLSAFDKGVGKGAVINTELAVYSAKDRVPLYTLISTTFARGDGGFGGPNGAGLEPHKIPDRKPDLTAAAETRIDQALLYRLNGDRNPLHADPELAKRAGFPVPICMACAPTAPPAVQFSRRSQSTTTSSFAASTCASPHPYILARPSLPTCGSTRTSSLSAAG